MLDKLSAADFLPHLNNEFRIYFDPSSPLAVELIEVSEKSSTTSNAERLPFSIVFRGPKNTDYQQGTYKVNHKDVGEILLFLVPIGPDDEGLCYEAIFN